MFINTTDALMELIYTIRDRKIHLIYVADSVTYKFENFFTRHIKTNYSKT